MPIRARTLVPLLLAVALFGCGPAPDADDLGEAADALDICSEMVPANRQVDGIPAYAQCDTTTDASIWSNNGVDTSLTEVGPGWVRTQRGGGYQCTELAYRYMYFRWNVAYRSGNAEEWCDGDLPDDLVIAPTPVHGDLIVFAGGVCGSDETTGHIAVIDTVDAAAAKVTIVEENRAGRRSTNQSCATCFLHAVANDGSAGGAAGAGGAAATGGAAGSGTAGGTSGGSGVAGAAGMAAQNGGAGGSAGAAAGGPASTAGIGGVSGATASGGGAKASGGSAGMAVAGTGGVTSGGAGATTGGTVGAGGSGGAGAPSSIMAGMPGVAGTATVPDGDAAATSVEGGMGCSVTASRAPSTGAPWWVALGLALLRRRRTR